MATVDTKMSWMEWGQGPRSLLPRSADEMALRVSRLKAVIRNDVARGLYYGAVIRVSRGDELILSDAIGCADAGTACPLQTDSVFNLLSVTKAFTNVLTLRAIELGLFALTTKVVDIVPEFSGAPRDRVTVFNLLTHTSGLPALWTPKPDIYQDRLDELLQGVLECAHGISEPGTRCDYSPSPNHVLLGEILRRTDPKSRNYRDLVHEDLFAPLGMKDTWMGVRSDLRARKIVLQTRGVIPIKTQGRTQPGPAGLFEEEVNDAPHIGAVSTAEDLWRFAEMLRLGGCLDGHRVLTPRTIALARRNWTQDMPNELYKAVALRAGWMPVPPAYIGLGFGVRGEKMVHHQFGTLTTPETFGNYGAGSTIFWIDPELDISFVCLTSGLMTQAPNIERFQRLSDMAVAAALA